MLQVERAFRVEDVHVSGHEVDLVAVPFGVPVVVRDRQPDDTYGTPYREAWERGAFRNVVKAPHRVRLAVGTHKAAWARELASIMGRGMTLTEEPGALRGQFRVRDSRMGEELVSALGDGEYRGVSIGAGLLRSRRDGDVTVRTLATLDHVLLTESPQIPGAEVVAVRDDPDTLLAKWWTKYMAGA